MYPFLLFLHSLFRWIVLVGLLAAIIRAGRGMLTGAHFSRGDNRLRHWTATIVHIQFMVGMVLYLQSPVVRFFWKRVSGLASLDLLFYPVLHALLMLSAVVVVTIGSAKAKRQPSSRQKFRTMLIWFFVALLIILIAVPWPFSPLAQRPLIRSV